MPDICTEKTYTASFFIELSVILLMAISTVFVFSASANVSTNYDLHNFYDFTALKQIIFFPIAVIVMYAVSRVDYRKFDMEGKLLRSWTPYFMAVTIFLLILVLIPGLFPEKNMSKRWITISVGSSGISFQPSELAKWSLIIFLAAWGAKYRENKSAFIKRFAIPCLFIGVIAGLIITEDFGSAFLVCLLAFIMLFLSGCRIWYLLAPIPLIIPAFILAIITSPTRINRIKAFLDPESAVKASYQAKQSLIAISSGGLWGKGLGLGVSKYGHLPEDTTDFIFAVICEEMGLIGGLTVLVLFTVFAVAGVRIILNCKDRFGKLLAAGIVMAICMQAVLNIGVVTVVLPTKGIALPFVSAGGTGMMLSAAAAGLILSIARHTSIEQRQRYECLVQKARKMEQPQLITDNVPTPLKKQRDFVTIVDEDEIEYESIGSKEEDVPVSLHAVKKTVNITIEDKHQFSANEVNDNSPADQTQNNYLIKETSAKNKYHDRQKKQTEVINELAYRATTETFED